MIEESRERWIVKVQTNRGQLEKQECGLCNIIEQLFLFVKEQFLKNAGAQRVAVRTNNMVSYLLGDIWVRRVSP
jgi:hypothetical protein